MQKVSLVIGNKSGIGLEIYNKLKNETHKVIGYSRRINNKSNEFQLDISSLETNKLNFKFNNLIFAHRYRGNDPIEEYKTMVVGPINFIFKNLKNFKKNSSIIFLGSSAYNLVFKEQDVFYHASRGAINSLTKYLSYELGKIGIRVNCINPSTLIKKENQKFYKIKKNRLNLESVIPSKKMTNSKQIAELCSYLCSNCSEGISGQTFVIDYGLTNISQETIIKDLIKSRNA